MMSNLKLQCMRKLIGLCVFLMMLGIQLSMAQERQVTGMVTDANEGTPLPGVTIIVKGTTNGVTTDIDGKYSIKVAPDAVLVFSFIGMEAREIVVGERTEINVKLKTASHQMEEVVVTALGMTKAAKGLAYSAAQVDNEEITRGGERSALTALQGKIAGVNISSSSGAPGASTRIVLRGYSSIAGSNEPLFVVDGVPVNNSMVGSTSLNGSVDFGNRVNDINPSDIESISILKGASASALYGSRAANGVVLITTKKGKMQDKLKIEYTNNTLFSTPLRLPKMQNRFGQGWSSGHFLEENGSWGPKFDGKNRIWGHVVNGQQQYKPYIALKDNIRDFFETGVTETNSITLSGGREKASYYLGYSNIYDNGILPTDKDYYKRNSINLRGEFKGDIVSSSAAISYINKKVSAAQGGQGLSVYNNLMQIPRDISIVDHKDYHGQFASIDEYFTPYGVTNPYYTLNEDGNIMNDDRVFGNVQVNVKVTPWMLATVRIGNDYSSYQTKQWRSIAVAGGSNEGDVNEKGMVSEGSGYSNEFNADAFVQFNPTFGKFSLNATIGYNVNVRTSKALSTSVEGLDLPFFYNLANSSSTPVVEGTLSQRRLIGAYGNIDLSFHDYLFLNIGMRNDWSSTLPEENRSFFYPAVGLSAVLTDAIPALKKVFSFAKIRGSYGETGNDATPYSLKSVFVKSEVDIPFGSTIFPLGGVNAYEVSNTIGNPDLKPERTREFEFGADLRFWENRINVDFTYYKRNTKDQILRVPIAHSSGYSTQWMNLGNVENKGVELMVGVTPIRNKDWNWDINFTFTKNKNKVIELSPLLQKVSLGGLTTVGFFASEGLPMGYYEGTVVKRDPQGRPVVDANGLPIASDVKENLGNVEPDYSMGISTALSWKGLSLSAQVDIKKGGYIYSRTADINYFVGNAEQTLFNDRQPFIVPNSVREYTDAEGNSVYAENTTPISMEKICDYWNSGGVDFDKSFLLDKTHVRLREVVLTYSLPKKIFKNSFIGGIDISLIGRNLALWTPKGNKFIDPETTTFGNNLEGEYGEFSTSPSIRNLGFSIKISL